MSEVLLDLTREEWELVAESAMLLMPKDVGTQREANERKQYERIAAYAERKALTASARTNIYVNSDLGDENQVDI